MHLHHNQMLCLQSLTHLALICHAAAQCAQRVEHTMCTVHMHTDATIAKCMLAGIVGTGNALQWAWEYPKLAAYTGNCSFLASQGDTFLHNFASDAGAVLFSTNMSTTKISCFPFQDNDTLSFARNISSASCDTWRENLVGVVGYGNSAAFLPAKLLVEMPNITRYVSNGSSTLGFTAQVHDEAGTQVTLGMCPVTSFLQLRHDCA